MTIYSLYIFDRHCECVYYQDWHRTRPVRPTPHDKPDVHRLQAAAAPGQRESIFSSSSGTSGHPNQPGQMGQHAQQAQTGSVVAGTARKVGSGLPFDEEAKLVYGVVLSMRNLVKKLSGKDEHFTSYKTSQYGLHLYETLTGFKFVLLSDPSTDSLRFVLRQIHTGPFVDHVVRNPLVEMDSRERGIDNDQFRTAVDKHIRSLTMFN